MKEKIGFKIKGKNNLEHIPPNQISDYHNSILITHSLPHLHPNHLCEKTMEPIYSQTNTHIRASNVALAMPRTGKN